MKSHEISTNKSSCGFVDRFISYANLKIALYLSFFSVTGSKASAKYLWPAGLK
jgi:hypothetical protein